MGGFRAALRSSGFRALAIGSGCSALGDGLSFVTVAWIALDLAPEGAEGIAVGAATAALYLPGLLGSALLLARTARFGPQRLLMADSLLRGICFLGIAVLQRLDVLTLPMLVGLLAASALLHALGVAARRSLVGYLLEPTYRLAGNAVLAGQEQMSLVVGPVLAGVIIAGFGAETAMAVDALSYFALAAALLAVRVKRVIAGEVGDPSRLLKQLRTLVAYPRVMALLLITFVFFLLYGPVEVAIPVLVNSTLAAGPESLGLVWTAFGLGAVLGSFAAGLLQRTPVLAGCVAVVALWGAIIVAAAFASSTAQLGAALFIGGLVFGPYNPLSISFIQAEVDLADLAPVNAAWASALLAATPVGVLLGGPLVTAVGPSATLLSMGLGTVLAALLGVGLLTRSRRGRA